MATPTLFSFDEDKRTIKSNVARWVARPVRTDQALLNIGDGFAVLADEGVFWRAQLPGARARALRAEVRRAPYQKDLPRSVRVSSIGAIVDAVVQLEPTSTWRSLGANVLVNFRVIYFLPLEP